MRSWFLLGFDPGGKTLAIDPQVVPAIPLVRCTGYKPIPQSAIRDTQFFTQLTQGVEHGQQARGADDDEVGDFRSTW
jgi:hypothetical protein